MDSLEWKETVSGTYERSLDRAEVYFHTLSLGAREINREVYCVYTGASFNYQGSDVVERFRTAWLATRYQHPAIATSVLDSKKIYTVPNSSQLDSWLHETFQVVESSADEYMSRVKPFSLPTLYVFPRSQQILLYFPHVYMDGVGSLIFLDSLFRNFSKNSAVEFGDEAVRLSKSLWSATSVGQPTTDQEAQVMLEAGAMFSNLPGLDLKTAKETAVPKGTFREELVFSETESAAIFVATKELNVTITNTVMAAVMLATKQLSDQKNRKYCSGITVNARPLVGTHAKDPTTNYNYWWPMVINPTDWLETIQQLQALLHRVSTKTFEMGLFAKLAEIATPQPDQPPIVVSGPIQSLGVLETYLERTYGNFELLKVWMAVEKVTPEPCTYVYTFRDQLTLSACYCPDIQGTAAVKELLALTKEILLKELSVV
jgi:hypothetical protein